MIISYNASDSLFIKINITLVNKHYHLLQISVWDLQNDMILPFPPGACFGARTVNDKVCIRYTSLRKYMPEYIKPMMNRNEIKCV